MFAAAIWHQARHLPYWLTLMQILTSTAKLCAQITHVIFVYKLQKGCRLHKQDNKIHSVANGVLEMLADE